MEASYVYLLCVGFCVAAALYSSVGHGGASAYIALMTLSGMAPEEIRPAALVLNVLVAGAGAIRFIHAGRFDWRVFWPFAVTAIPAAFIAGRVELPDQLYRSLLAAALAAAAARYLLWPHIDARKTTRPPPTPVALGAGAGLGALAGLTGIGGGVYLSPLLVFCGWTDAQRAAGVAALFIVVNSLAGLAGRAPTLAQLPPFLPLLALSVSLGAWAGITLSIAKFDKPTLLRALGLVLGLAAWGLTA